MTEPRNLQREIEELRQLARELSARIERVEQALASEPGARQPQASPPPNVGPAWPRPPAPPKSDPKPLPSIPPRPVREATLPEADLESRNGSHWLNRIGITAVLIGVSYFLKFAFDNDWIGPAGGVSIGLLVGIAVVIWGVRFGRRGLRAFSYSLQAVGIGVRWLWLMA